MSISIVKSFSFPKGTIRGDMFYIKHASQNFTVIDSFLKDGDEEDLFRKQEIIDEIKRESRGRVCRFISTHPDNDHIAGLEDLNKCWPIRNFYAVKNKRPDDGSKSMACYTKLLQNKNCPIKRGLERCWLNRSNNYTKSSRINFHWPDLTNDKFKQALEHVSKGTDINNICPIFTYKAGTKGATYMWMGDLETDMQQVYYDAFFPNIPHVDILFHPHHGRDSGKVPQKLLEALNPKLIVIGNAPSENLNYAKPELTITQNRAGDICFMNIDNKVHVYTEKHINNKPACLTDERQEDFFGEDENGVLHFYLSYIGSFAI